MKSILITLYGFDEKNSNNANAICIYESLESLKSYYNIYIVTTTEENEISSKTSNGVNIHYIPLRKKNKKLDFTGWNRAASKYIIHFMENHIIDKLITISFPFLIHFTGLKVKRKYSNLEWIVYELDPYAYNHTLRLKRVGFLFRFYLENKIFMTSDKIYLTHELYNQYSTNLFSKYKYKFKDIGIPLLRIKKNNSVSNRRNQENRKFNVVYLGSFYNKIRNPKFMLDVMKIVVSKNPHIYFHIYGPERDSNTNKYLLETENRIVFHGRVSKEKINEIINVSDIFINIGNSIDNQLPSKVLEYIATGKPIINFYNISADTSNNYLKKYPLALIVKENYAAKENVADKVTNFIIEKSDKNVEPKILYKIYYEDTIEMTISRFIKFLE